MEEKNAGVAPAQEEKPLTRKDWLKAPAEEEKREKKEAPVQPEFINEFRPSPSGTEAFANRGVAYLKRVSMDRKTGKESVRVQAIIISTARLDAVTNKFANENKPRPRAIDKLFAPESEIGRALNLTKPEVISVPDMTDREYVNAVEVFNNRAMWALAAEAIDVPLHFDEGSGSIKRARSTKEKILALKQAGLQDAHILEIAGAVARINHFTDIERRSFFGESSAR